MEVGRGVSDRFFAENEKHDSAPGLFPGCSVQCKQNEKEANE